MLKIDPSINHIPIGREQVFSLYESINQPLVNFPTTGTAATGAFVLGTRNSHGYFTVFVYLYQRETKGVVVYVSEPRALTREQFIREESDGIRFVESMGFMVDNTNFEHLDPGAKTALIERAPLFRPPEATLDLYDVLEGAASADLLRGVGTSSGSPTRGASDLIVWDSSPLPTTDGPPIPVMEGKPATPPPARPPVVSGQLLRAPTPAFGADPLNRAASRPGEHAKDDSPPSVSLDRLGRLLGTFGLLWCLSSVVSACATDTRSRGTTEGHLQLGNQHLSQGNWAEAVRAFGTVLEDDPKDREALWGTGLAYWRLGRREKAEEYLQKAVVADPKWSVPKVELAAVLTELERCVEAEKLLRQVLEDIFYPTPQFAAHNLALALQCQGRVDEAITELDNLVIKQPHFCLGYLTLAQLSAQEKKPEVTIRACEGFEANCENNEEIRRQILPEQSAMCYLKRGMAHAELGELESARASFMRCQSSGPFGVECVRSLNMLPP